MQPKQTLQPYTERNVSETGILLFSFITAFTIGIIIISTLFVAAKKIETRVHFPSDITYVETK